MLEKIIERGISLRKLLYGFIQKIAMWFPSKNCYVIDIIQKIGISTSKKKISQLRCMRPHRCSWPLGGDGKSETLETLMLCLFHEGRYTLNEVVCLGRDPSLWLKLRKLGGGLLWLCCLELVGVWLIIGQVDLA